MEPGLVEQASGHGRIFPISVGKQSTLKMQTMGVQFSFRSTPFILSSHLVYSGILSLPQMLKGLDLGTGFGRPAEGPVELGKKEMDVRIVGRSFLCGDKGV